MEYEVLSKRNCHRAQTVRLKDEPERGEWQWSFNGHNNGNGYFSSVATNGESKIIVSDHELSNWEVISWKYPQSLDGLYSYAVQAFSRTSHVPETRALQYIRGYEADLVADLAELPKEWQVEYYGRYLERVRDLFRLHARIASPMIVGPARFPTERNRKANDSYDKAASDFIKWRESFANRAKRYLQSLKSPEQLEAEEWEPIRKDILSHIATIKGIDEGTERGYRRSLFVNSIYGKVATLAKNGKVGLVARATELIKSANEKLGKPVFTSRHKFWKLAEECQKQVEAKAARADREDVEVEFEGGRVVKNYSDDRLQIFHDEKPSRDVIDTLKNNGFRWSPNNGCWQRQLTENAIFSAAWVLVGKSSTFAEREEWIKKIRNAK